MAVGGNPSATLHEEATCSICLDYFQEPVIIAECGHNFCRACITQHQEKGSDPGKPQCPQCRRTFSQDRLLPNRPLKNMVATIRQLSRLSLSKTPGQACAGLQEHRDKSPWVPGPPSTFGGPQHLWRPPIGTLITPCPAAFQVTQHGPAPGEMVQPQRSSANKGYKSKSKWKEENVLLDPETAHPRYIVSDDWKSVSWADVRQNIFSPSPKRFQYARCILGTRGFASGKHRWTVDVGDGDYWAVGVALESVNRDEELDFEPDEGIWAIARYGDEYKALTWPRTSLGLYGEPIEIRVCLNYGAGSVDFYDAEDNTCLYSFQSVDFEGEKVFPFFRITDLSTSLQLLY